MSLTVSIFVFLFCSIFLVLLSAAHFAPAIIAFRRKHDQRWLILGLNVFFGWTVIGWIALLCWAYQASVFLKPETGLDRMSQLEKLSNLYQSGSVTKEEFLEQKAALLKR